MSFQLNCGFYCNRISNGTSSCLRISFKASKLRKQGAINSIIFWREKLDNSLQTSIKLPVTIRPKSWYKRRQEVYYREETSWRIFHSWKHCGIYPSCPVLLIPCHQVKWGKTATQKEQLFSRRGNSYFIHPPTCTKVPIETVGLPMLPPEKRSITEFLAELRGLAVWEHIWTQDSSPGEDEGGKMFETSLNIR